MMRKLCSMHPKIVNRCNSLLLHDNAKPHTSRITILKLYKLKFEVMPHPAYSPYLALTDFHFFRNLNNFLVEKIQFPRRCRKCFPRFRRVPYSKLLHEWHETTSVEIAEVHWQYEELVWLNKYIHSLSVIKQSLFLKSNVSYLTT